MSQPAAENGRRVAIDALRGVAVLGVIVCHLPRTTGPAFSGAWWAGLVPDLGALGVTLFLVLSGYCIHARAARDPLAPIDWRAFWRRRMVRLYPVYLVALGISIFLDWNAGRPWPTIADVLAHLTLTHNLTASYSFSAGNAALWSLGMEVQVYLLYPAYLALRRRWPATRVAAVALAVTVIWRLSQMGLQLILYRRGWAPPPQQSLFGLGSLECWPFAFWAPWVLGAVAAEVAAGTAAPPRWLMGRAMAFGCLAIAVVTHPRVLWTIAKLRTITDLSGGLVIKDSARWLGVLAEPALAVSSAALLIAWTRPRAIGPRGRWMQWLAAAGAVSYSLYLVHLPILRGPLAGWLNIDDRWPAVCLRQVTALAACGAAAYLLFIFVERPFARVASTAASTDETGNRRLAA